MKPTEAAAARPPIDMIDTEAEKLADLALLFEERTPEVSALLLDEIDRATLHGAGSIGKDVVTMGSRVEFVDEGSGRGHIVELVYPQDADIAAGRISVLTQVGAGLIGLRAGQSIFWPGRDGQERRLVIVRVSREARAA
jgi:regulator of nucleoside diphosphate kinase